MPTPLGGYYGSFEPEELDKLERFANCVKLIIDTRRVKVKRNITGLRKANDVYVKFGKAKAFYVRFPADVNHIDAVAEYISRTKHRKISRDDLNTDNASHVVGAIINMEDLK